MWYVDQAPLYIIGRHWPGQLLCACCAAKKAPAGATEKLPFLCQKKVGAVLRSWRDWGTAYMFQAVPTIYQGAGIWSMALVFSEGFACSVYSFEPLGTALSVLRCPR